MKKLPFTRKTATKTTARARTPKGLRPPMELRAVFMFADPEFNDLATSVATTFAHVPAQLMELEAHSLDEQRFFEEMTDRYYGGGYSGEAAAAQDDADHSRRVAYYMGIAMGWYLTAQLRAGAR